MLKKIIPVVILLVSASSLSSQAQTATGSQSSNSISKQSTAEGPATPSSESASPADQYKSSLQGLVAFYDEEIKRLTEQNTKIKELFNDGLVSRRDVEQSDQAVAEARKKLEDVNNQIATAKTAATKSTTGAAIISGAISIPWSTGNQQIDFLIRSHGERYGVDPYLIYCIMNQESGFRTSAISNKGAQGLMQLMPATAARYGVRTIYDPSQNIMGGTRYLKDLMELFDGKVELVLAAYNAGEGAVMKYGNRIPPYKETQDYVRNISARYKAIKVVPPTSKTATESSVND